MVPPVMHDGMIIVRDAITAERIVALPPKNPIISCEGQRGELVGQFLCGTHFTVVT